MKPCLLFFMAAGMILFNYVNAQSTNQESFRLTESLIESIVGSEQSDDYESVLLELEKLNKHPIDLNYASVNELQKLPFLTDFQILSLIEYREENGNIISLYELQVIHGFTEEIIHMMLPFVKVSSDAPARTINFHEMITRGSHEVAIRMQRVFQESKGYKLYDSIAGDTKYPGSPWLLNAKYEFTMDKHVFAGFTVEKDPGEDLFKSSNRNGFDFNSAYIFVQDFGVIRSAVIGDYRLAFGQGLTLWTGAASGKSSLPLNIIKRQDAVKAFVSNDENNYFRGFASSVSLGKLTLTAFYSSKKRDANITDTLSEDHICFSSFQESGYHRTFSEIADEKSVRETSFGGNILFRNNILKVGSTLIAYKFDKYLQRGDDLEDLYDFSGNSLLNWGIDYSVTIKKINLFGETSYGNGSWATLNGLLINVNKYASLALLYRNFGAGYLSFQSAAFSENSSNTNEEGLYAGIVIHPAAKFKISGYVDFYRFPWLKSGLSAPSSGRDYLMQIDFNASKAVQMYCRIKFSSDPEDFINDTSLIPEVIDMENSGIRYHISYRLSKKLAMQNRIEVVNSGSFPTQDSRGILIYHDLEWKFLEFVTLDFRLSWFNTGDYASRIYAYEQDMSTGFSFSPLYNTGYRSYAMVRMDISKRLSLWIRFSNTSYMDKTTIGSGYDMISSDHRNDLKIKLALRF